MKSVIVIGNDHHNTLGLVRSLGCAGLDVTCIVLKTTMNSFVTTSKYIKSYKHFASLDDVLAFLLREVKVVNHIPILTASDQIAEFLDQHYDELKKKFFLFNCGLKQGSLGKWMNKDIMLNAAKEAGLIVPFSRKFNVENDDIRNLSEMPFPCIIKPEKSSEAGKENVRICRSFYQLKEALNDIKDNCQETIIQEYIDRDYEFLIMGMRSSKNNTVILPGGLHKLRTCKNTNSLGMFSYAYTTEIIDEAIDIEAIKRFLETIDYDGIFSIEFMISKGNAYFLEINLRNDGTQFCFEGAGVNLPLLWIKASEGVDISTIPIKLKKKFCMVEVNYLKNLDWHHPFIALKELHHTNLFAVWDKKDWKPALFKILYAIRWK